MLRTIGAYGLVEEGDRILVAVSGGKDSYTLLDLLQAAKRKSPVHYELIAVHLDQQQPGYDGAELAAWLENFDAPCEIICTFTSASPSAFQRAPSSVIVRAATTLPLRSPSPSPAALATTAALASARALAENSRYADSAFFGLVGSCVDVNERWLNVSCGQWIGQHALQRVSESSRSSQHQLDSSS